MVTEMYVAQFQWLMCRSGGTGGNIKGDTRDGAGGGARVLLFFG